MPVQLGETVGRFVPESVKKHIPLKATSLNQFMGLVVSENGIVVHVEPVTRIKGPFAPLTAVGRTATYEYLTEYTSYTPGGRKIVFREVYGQRFGSRKGMADAEERDTFAIRLFLTTDARLHEIQERLPHVQTGGLTIEMTAAEREGMYANAKRFNIAPFPRPQ